MARADIFSASFKEEPFWWIAAPRPPEQSEGLPASVDVAVVGSGVTGLNAARELARAGRKVLVLDAEALGTGASSRNAGNIGRVLKHEFTQLLRRQGESKAVAYYREMQAAYDAVEAIIQQESIDCHFQKNGRLILAYNESQLEVLEKEARTKKEYLGEDYQVLTRLAVEREIPGTAFAGAVYLPDSAAFHPGLYHLGLLQAAKRQGASFASHTTVTGVRRLSKGSAGIRFEVETSSGSIRAADVIIATNGYSKGGVPGYLKRRLIPFDAYMIAVEVPEDIVATITPNDRVYIDANHNLFFFRRAPDNKHILFGGRTGYRRPKDLRTIGCWLFEDACRLLPCLQEHKVARVWTGRCAGTFDLYPHIGSKDGFHYAAGYCFAGMPMGTYLGCKLAHGLLGEPGGETIFRERSFPTLPGYTGNPWFVPYVMKYYDWLDRRSTAQL